MHASDVVHGGTVHDSFSWTGVAIHLRACGHFTEAAELAIRRLERNQSRSIPPAVFTSDDTLQGHNVFRRRKRQCLHRWRQTRLGGRRLLLKTSSVKTASERSRMSCRCTKTSVLARRSSTSLWKGRRRNVDILGVQLHQHFVATLRPFPELFVVFNRGSIPQIGDQKARG